MDKSQDRTVNKKSGGLTRRQVAAIVGPIADAKATAIIATGATLSELEQAVAWASGESDVMGKLHRRVSPTVGAVYDILTAEEKFPDERA